MSRPYLIVPQLIEQPTWGGDYILKIKGWNSNQEAISGKIGQSYELSGTSRLALHATNSDHLLSLTQSGGIQGSIAISQIEPVYLLIKLNQARGNSFQLHIKPDTEGTKWKPKPESWYFLENGSITLGVKPHVDLSRYKNMCIEIDTFMHSLSNRIKERAVSLDEARRNAKHFVLEKNPWQFVNKYNVKKYDLIDLSMGAIHHSWEKDTQNAPLGNVVFEVQVEASDDEATIRSFDQGKIKDDGSVRNLSINEYFTHIDSNPTHNALSYLKRFRKGDRLLSTKYYQVKIIKPVKKTTIYTKGRYQHLYVRDGVVAINGGNISIVARKGHSCFIPSSLSQYTIEEIEPKTVVLKTYATNS